MDSSTAASAQKSFDLIDCAVFAGMLAISAIVGVYQAYKARKNTDAVREYLVGGQNMSIFPISMSLIASYISGITILGLPAEMYVYGTQFWCIVIADLFVSLTMALVYLPVFYGLGITSSYEYLKLRFNGAVRLMGCAIFLVKMMLYIPLVIYVPALAFNQVTGINLHAIALLVCAVCIFYTTLGGLKAVVWTDAIQTILMFGGVIIVAIHGTGRAGGFERVWKRNRDTDRIEFFDMDPDPTVRHTFWTVVIGNYLNWLASCSVNQAMVQRCLAMPNLSKANATIAIMAIGTMSIVSLSCYTGLVIFATFYDCDPITTKRIRKPDQLLPYFVMEMAESIPGLPGLFVAGVFSAALSTMSTGLNSMAGVIYEDMIKPWLRVPLSDVAASRTMKATVVLTGIACVTLVFLVEKLGGLIQAGKSLSGITAGPLLGIFTLGMFFPLANSTFVRSEQGSFGRRSGQPESRRLDIVGYTSSHRQREDRVSGETGLGRRMSGLAEGARRQSYAGRRNRYQGTTVLSLSNVLPLVHLGRFSDRDRRRPDRLLDHRSERAQAGRRKTLHTRGTPLSSGRERRHRETRGKPGAGEYERGLTELRYERESVAGRRQGKSGEEGATRQRNDQISVTKYLYVYVYVQVYTRIYTNIDTYIHIFT
ncbi:sodium-coupled monocarboxylate transporter 1 isoform X5 [Megachile rotundata]|uniref:sodium-coupled monocarboxylate transporter 1 isoform X5 n=1 Tax=Megachile rotundata TaxID=143995 RepID=UPI003FCFD005